MWGTLFLSIRIVLRLFRVAFAAIWAIGAGVVIFITRMLTPSTEDKLRELEPPVPSDQATQAQRCPQCTTLNEATAEFCYVCGTSLSMRVE